jgi:hypothetical protein
MPQQGTFENGKQGIAPHSKNRKNGTDLFSVMIKARNQACKSLRAG